MLRGEVARATVCGGRSFTASHPRQALPHTLLLSGASNLATVAGSTGPLVQLGQKKGLGCNAYHQNHNTHERQCTRTGKVRGVVRQRPWARRVASGVSAMEQTALRLRLPVRACLAPLFFSACSPGGVNMLAILQSWQRLAVGSGTVGAQAVSRSGSDMRSRRDSKARPRQLVQPIKVKRSGWWRHKVPHKLARESCLVDCGAHHVFVGRARQAAAVAAPTALALARAGRSPGWQTVRHAEPWAAEHPLATTSPEPTNDTNGPPGCLVRAQQPSPDLRHGSAPACLTPAASGSRLWPCRLRGGHPHMFVLVSKHSSAASREARLLAYLPLQ